MASFTLVYGTDEGQTAKIAERIRDVLEHRGHEVSVVDVDRSPTTVELDEADAAIIGASIHVSKHQSEVIDFVTTHRETLAAIPSAFYQVSLSSATEEGEAQAAAYVETFIEETGWHPDRIARFGGALRFSEYGFLKRLMMRQIAKRTVTESPPPDAAGDIEFTDWTEVESFAADVASFVEGRLGIVPSGEV